jgi:hypothetical protein
MTGPTITFIHATQASIAPTVEAFGAGFPEAEPWHLLDDRLARDADAAGGLTPALRGRMLSLIRHAVDGGTQAVQLCCSIYGPVAVAGSWDVPVLSSDEQMFREVTENRPARVGVLAALAASAADSVHQLAAVAGPTTTVVPVLRSAGLRAPSPDKIFHPGEPENRAAATHGVDLPDKIIDDLRWLAQSCGVPVDLEECT